MQQRFEKAGEELAHYTVESGDLGDEDVNEDNATMGWCIPFFWMNKYVSSQQHQETSMWAPQNWLQSSRRLAYIHRISIACNDYRKYHLIE